MMRLELRNIATAYCSMACAFAQVTGPTVPIAYAFGKGVIPVRASIAEALGKAEARLVCLEPGGRRMAVKLPPGGSDFHTFDGAMYCQVVLKEGKLREVHQSLNGSNWERVAVLDTQQLDAQRIRPLGGAFWLLGSTRLPFREASRSSWFLIARADSRGRLTSDRLLDVMLPGRQPTTPGEALASISWPNSAYGFRMLPVADGWALIHERLGIGFTVRNLGGSIRESRFRIHPELEATPVDKLSPDVVLGSYCTPTGGLLLATRTQNAVLDPGSRLAGMFPGQTPAERYRSRKAMALAAHPDIQFWRVEVPFTRAERTLPPEGIPEVLPTLADLERLAFYLDARGQVRRME